MMIIIIERLMIIVTLLIIVISGGGVLVLRAPDEAADAEAPAAQPDVAHALYTYKYT